MWAKNMKYDEEEFLKAVLSIASVNGVDSERELAVFLRDFLLECEVHAVLQEIDSRHANVLAVLEGESEETVLWNGHLDTVPYGKLTEWNTDPSVPTKKNGCYFARGASDMKGGLAAMVWTLGYMKQKGRVPKQTIYFCGTCDEERNGLGAKHFISSDVLRDASLLLIGEPTSLLPGVAQKGCIWLKLVIHGKTSHGAYPGEGVNAIEYGIAIFQQLKEKIEEKTHPVLGKSTVQMSMAKGGIVPNMTPDEAEFTLDIRVVPGITSKEVLEWANQIAEECEQQTGGRLRTEIYVKNDRKAIEIDKNHPWLKKLEWNLRCEQLPYEHTGINYFTDASILTKAMPKAAVLLFGPGEADMAHKADEYLQIQKYLAYIRVLLKLF
ncbi:M20 family metallopeptidase [Roseburia hominis]